MLIAALELEPALRPVQDRLGLPLGAQALPLDLLAHESLADRVGGIEKDALQVVHRLQYFLELLGIFLFDGAGVLGWCNLPGQAGHGAASLGHLGIDVGVALFHVLEQLVLPDDVALLGGQHDRGQTRGREAA